MSGFSFDHIINYILYVGYHHVGYVGFIMDDIVGILWDFDLEMSKQRCGTLLAYPS